MRLIAFLSILLCLGCKETNEKISVDISPVIDVSKTTGDDALEVYDYNGLKPFLNKKDDKVYVVNFWATWCAPCVKELPSFEKVNELYKQNNVEVLLVSLDFPRHYDKKLIPFIDKHQLKSKVVALDDPDQNTWIPAISEDWSGAIPATVIYNKDKRTFYEQSFTYEELETEIKRFLK